MNRPYSEATVELVAAAMPDGVASAHGCTPDDCMILDDMEGSEWQTAARHVLDALAAAGLLLPEGAETRTEYVVRIRREDGSSRVIESAQLPTEQLAHEVAAEPYWSPAVRREVVRRHVLDEVIATYPDAAGLAVGDSKPTQDPSVSPTPKSPPNPDSVSVEETPHG